MWPANNRKIMVLTCAKNAGNEAIFFTTSVRYDALGYLPVVATINPDCTIGLTLPYDGAAVLMVCTSMRHSSCFATVC
jgi:hypothetical protein